MKSSILTAGLFLIGIAASAQDTSGKKIKITSSFKPVLKEAAKINFNASPAIVDTSRPRLQYAIPNQNLNFAFQPGTLRPLALAVDTGANWTNESYVKAGFGNFSTPFVQLGLSVGDGKAAGINLYGRHVSSKGKLDYQDYSNTNAELNAFFKSGNIEWSARLGGLQEKYNKYGYMPKTLQFSEDSLDVKLQTWRGRIAFRNINRTDLGISYSPEMKVDIFNDQLSNSESNTYINVPIQKMVDKKFGVDLALTGNFSIYKPEDKPKVNNNWFAISPSLLYKTANLNIQAGLRPAWDNSSFKLFPNIIAEVASSDQRFSFQAGWTGYMRNSGFQYQTRINPWIWAPVSVFNSRVEERFAGFKGSAGDHFSYSAKIAFNKINNQPLFTNDTINGGKSFMVINEPEMKVLNFGGELGYTVGERFSLISNLQFNQYNPKFAEKAWGLLPLEWKTTMRLQVLKDLYVNGDLYAFDGPRYLLKSGKDGNIGSSMDLSAGLEFKVYKNIKVWGQFNNLLNKEYQRWNQYPVYGFNFLAGVVFSFAQKQ
ncbi:MAG: TonB-dependent receptor [Chitinophagaceae bacterium]|nr:MAG: TonB-dependent receptor [Chitinophagaceae bacterium]